VRLKITINSLTLSHCHNAFTIATWYQWKYQQRPLASRQECFSSIMKLYRFSHYDVKLILTFCFYFFFLKGVLIENYYWFKSYLKSFNWWIYIFLATTTVKSQILRGKINQTSTTRNPKIMFGFPTRDGEFGWQASLELLHPSLGFIGHWCGCVLIHRHWVISSAHCIHK
jgi:hypothetical protein